MISFDPSLSAMNAFGTGVNTTAHNVANINTDGFNPQVTNYQSGPNDQGVRANVQPGFKTTDTATFSPEALQAAGAAQVNQGSNVELGREMTNLITDQRAFEANAKTIATGDSMLGTAIDLKA